MIFKGEDMKICFYLLILFIRLFILWYVFLFRLKICVEVNNYSLSISGILKIYIEKERVDNKEFLRLFLFLSFEDIYVLVVFDLVEYMEFIIYFEEMCFLL